jgi:hypothetical protein
MMIVELEDNHPSFMQYESHIAEHSKVRQTILQANYKEIYKDHINTIFIKNN